MMRKKLGVVLAALLASASSLWAAAPVRFSFWTLHQHPEILGGFLPSWAGMGVGIDAPTLIPGRLTELQLLVGGGYLQRKVWIDPTNGLPLEKTADGTIEPLIFDVEEYNWRARFSQGFWQSPVEGKDLLTAYVGYEGELEKTHDSMVEGERRDNGGRKQDVSRIDSWFADHGSSAAGNKYYTDMGTTLLSTFFAGLKFDMMDDQVNTQDGFYTTLEARWLPEEANNACDGSADAYSITWNSVFAKTLYSLESETGRNLFSIVAVDRVNVDWTDGDKVPLEVQLGTALARKVRGFSYYSYNTNFSIVNNIDLRISLPSLWFRKIMPRFNLFYDVGFGCGNYYNTDVYAEHFLSSIGVQATVTFFDFVDLGLQYAYLFSGTNYQHLGDDITTRVTFFLDF